jgi:hypothetical protein
MATRRGFLAALLAASTVPRLGWAEAGSPAFLACAREADGSFALHGLRTDGSETFALPLPARGHAGAGHPSEALAVVFARRPGAYALVLDCARGTLRQTLTPPEGRQLNGHGAFLAGGAVLATSEQAADTSAGLVGLWDAEDGFRRVGEVATGGLGPHDVRLLPDGRTLLVANGGIATDPADRAKLNLDAMRPSLATLDPLGDGVPAVAELDAGLHQLSIRHLAVRPDGLAAFAMQWEGDPAEVVPLLGLRAPDGALALVEAPEAEAVLMRGYAGSVAWSGEGREVAITSPKGGRAQRFSPEGAFLGSFARPEACGLAPLPGGFLLSDGLGGLVRLGEATAPLGATGSAWDNHIVAL